MTTAINHISTLREMVLRKQEQLEMAKHSLSVYESFEDAAGSRTQLKMAIDKMTIYTFQSEIGALEAAIEALGANNGS